jgi:hypothetical protein
VRIPLPSGKLDLYERISEAFGKFGGVNGRKGIIILTTGRDAELLRKSLSSGSVPPASADKEFQKLVKQARERGIPLYFVATNTDKNLILTDPNDASVIFRDEYIFLRDYYGSVKGSSYANIKDRSLTIADDFLREVRSRMELLAEVSGGRIYFPARLDDVAPLYTQIARELGTSYSFGYAPRQLTPGVHRIQVQVSKPGLRVVQSRESYTAR